MPIAVIQPVDARAARFHRAVVCTSHLQWHREKQHGACSYPSLPLSPSALLRAAGPLHRNTMRQPSKPIPVPTNAPTLEVPRSSIGVRSSST